MNPEWKLGSNQNDLRSYGVDNVFRGGKKC